MRVNRIKRSRSEKILMYVLVVLLSIHSLTLLYPFLWMLMNSFKTANGFVKDIWGLPVSWQFQNWIVTFAGMYLNTLFFVVVNVSLNMFFNAISAYVVAKYEFKAMKVIYSIALIFFIVPMFGSIATLYKFLVEAKLYDTYAGIVLISLQFFNSTFLFLYAFFKNLSWTYAEAAFIDGAGHFKVFISIMMPMSIPAIGALGIMGIIGTWNEFFNVYMYAPSKATIGVGLHILSLNIRGEYPKLFAAMFISLLPIVVVFSCFQKTIMENTVAGGLKG